MKDTMLRRLVFAVLLSTMVGGCASMPPVTTLAAGQTGQIRFASLDISNEDFLLGQHVGKPAVASGELRLPPGITGRAPAVILAHGCGGISPADGGWAEALPPMGIATFRVDSFTARGILEACTGRWSISTGSRVVDAFRALELLATHPQIDPSRIAIMGFSLGGRVALWTSFVRFQRAWGPTSTRFAAHRAFYPSACWFTIIGDDQLTDRPVRIFHGTADDWIPIGPCRDYVERAKRAGNDIALIEYPGAHHAFDNPALPSVGSARPQALNPGRCHIVEEPAGRLVSQETKRPFDPGDPCVTRGATVGYDADAHRRAKEDVRAFLSEVFKLTR